MSGGVVLSVLIVPPLAAAATAAIVGRRVVRPEVVIALNALMPGSGLAAAARPFLEVVLGVMLAEAGLVIALSTEPGVWFLVMAAGGLWASLHTPWNPLTTLQTSGSSRTVGQPSPSTASATTSPAPPARAAATEPTRTVHPSPSKADGDTDDVEDSGYSVAIRCTECGADVDVPVLHRAARCGFCGSHHMVVGQDQVLSLSLPTAIEDDRGLTEAVLDHYRYLHYLALYKRSVAPLERQTTQATPNGILVNAPEVAAAAEAAEVAVARAADAYRAKLAQSLRVIDSEQFFVPYRHGMGTLYQAAFGRTRNDQEKHLTFRLASLEASRIATTVPDLPSMGKLSYLKALRPAAGLPESARAFPKEGADDDLIEAFGDLDRKVLARELQVIRLGSRFRHEISADVWRPFWTVEVHATGIHDRLLVDGASASVVGPDPGLDRSRLEALPEEARQPGSGLAFVPMECPTCGHEYRFRPEAVLHFCHNCHRVFSVDGRHKTEVPYGHCPVDDPASTDLVPFWRFPLRLATGDGQLLTDLWHLKDGIDGTFDQIGDDAAEHQHGVWMPAIRCINARLMTNAFVALLGFSIRTPPKPVADRFPLDVRPEPWSIGLGEDEAREILPLYLARLFSRRDLARVNVNQVGAWLFDARQQAPGQLVFAPVPRVVTEPFRAYVGRFTAGALRRAADS